MSAIYEISSNILDLLIMIEDNEVNVTDKCVIDTFEGLEGELDDKVNEWCRVIKSIEYEKKNLSEEIKRLQTKKISKENEVKKMRSALCDVLKKLGYDKYKTAEYTLYSFKSDKLDLKKELVPDELRKERVTKVIDEKAIKDLLLAGEDLPYAKLINNLTIRWMSHFVTFIMLEYKRNDE